MMVGQASLVLVFMFTSVLGQILPHFKQRLEHSGDLVMYHWQTCTPRSCFGLKYESVANSYYKGIFMSREEILKKDYEWRLSRKWRWGLKSVRLRMFSKPEMSNANRQFSLLHGSDYDYCCPTIRSHRQAPFWMTNTYGQLRAIFHMFSLQPKMYQWIPHARCVGGTGCKGTCKVEKITVNLLVYKFNSNWPFEFDKFSVDGYCSCKSYD